jgi:hypothetical protein
MKISMKILVAGFGLLIVTLLSCARAVDMSNTGGGQGSEIAVSVVSGGVNSAQTNVALFSTFVCSSGSFSPSSYAGSRTYTYAPGSCAVNYDNGKSSSTSWSGVWTYDYGTGCTGTSFMPKTQLDGCVITRTSASNGITRNLTDPNGNSYSVNHNTNGQGTGWDTAIAVTDGGVTVSCTNAGCTEQTLMINGSHLTAKVNNVTSWDHTVSTNTGLTMTVGSDGSHTVTGTVTVQHNLAKILSTTTFNNVNYGGTGEDCCFPTSGSVTTTYTGGPNNGKSETMTFSSSCGDATLTTTGRNSLAYPLLHCI